jgi:hypothetical protein
MQEAVPITCNNKFSFISYPSQPLSTSFIYTKQQYAKTKKFATFFNREKDKKKGFSPNYRTCSSEWPEPLTCAGICPPVEPACTQQHIPVSSFSTRTTGTGTNTPITLYRTGTVLQDNTIR